MTLGPKLVTVLFSFFFGKPLEHLFWYAASLGDTLLSTNDNFYLSHDIKITKNCILGMKMHDFAIFYATLKWKSLRNVTKSVILLPGVISLTGAKSCNKL